jgi:hypothetical protein
LTGISWPLLVRRGGMSMHPHHPATTGMRNTTFGQNQTCSVVSGCVCCQMLHTQTKGANENRMMPHLSHMRPPLHNITRFNCREASSFLLRLAARKTPRRHHLYTGLAARKTPGVIICIEGSQPTEPPGRYHSF